MVSKYDDFDRMLENWARWLFGSSSESLSCISNIYQAGPRPPRGGNVMPTINGEAIDLDKAIRRLHIRYQSVLKIEVQDWLYPTQALKASRCAMSVPTFKKSLDQAKEMAKREYYQACEKVRNS